MTTAFRMNERFGAFLADGDIANAFRFTDIEPAVARGEHVVLDFEGVTNMTDSFGNALVGTLIQNHPELLRSGLEFKNCNPLLRELVGAAVRLGRTFAQRQLA
jgi:hypothetical protein